MLPMRLTVVAPIRKPQKNRTARWWLLCVISVRVVIVARSRQCDKMVEGVVLGLLSETDIATRLTRRPGIDTVSLRVKRRALADRKDELATLFSEGVLDGNGVRRESEKLATRLPTSTRRWPRPRGPQLRPPYWSMVLLSCGGIGTTPPLTFAARSWTS